MCKHVKSTAASWNNCKTCIQDKIKAAIPKMQSQIVELTKEAEEKEALTGRKAHFQRDEIQLLQSQIDSVS